MDSREVPRPCEEVEVKEEKGECISVSLSVGVCVVKTSLLRSGNGSEVELAACYKEFLGGGG